MLWTQNPWSLATLFSSKPLESFWGEDPFLSFSEFDKVDKVIRSFCLVVVVVVVDDDDDVVVVVPASCRIFVLTRFFTGKLLGSRGTFFSQWLVV